MIIVDLRLFGRLNIYVEQNSLCVGSGSYICCIINLVFPWSNYLMWELLVAIVYPFLYISGLSLALFLLVSGFLDA